MLIKEAKDYVATYRVFGVDKGGLGAHQPPTSGVPGEKRKRHPILIQGAANEEIIFLIMRRLIERSVSFFAQKRAGSEKNSFDGRFKMACFFD